MAKEKITFQNLRNDGWDYDYSSHVQPGVSLCKGQFSIWIAEEFMWIRKGSFNENTIYRGDCPTIKQFKTLQKLLKIK